MNPAAGIDVETIIGIMAGTFALTATVIGILVRQLLKAYHDRTEEQLRVIKTEHGERLASTAKTVADVVEDRLQCESRENRAVARIESLMEKLRDQWLEFQKADATMEATRGRRLDAMFNVLDHQKDELRSIKPAVLQRQEELHKQGLEELRRDLRAYVRDLVKEGRTDG